MNRTARSALHPVALGLLAAGALGGALVTWPLAIAGVIGYGGAFALLARRSRSGRDDADSLPAPVVPASGIRSTAVMAHVVRIRKAHRALHQALVASSPSVRRLLSATYGRACQLVEYAYQQARVADDLRARLDAPSSLAGTVPLAKPARDALESAFAMAGAELTRVATALEQWQHKVVHAAPDTGAGVADEAARDVAEELERMLGAAREIEEATRGY